MFTGLIEELGSVEALELASTGGRLRVRCHQVLADSKPGASIAVNGACLTVTALGPNWFEADVSMETLRRTNLGDLRPGQPVNLERPLALGERLGGHLVLGHVDATGEVISLDPLGNGHWWLIVRYPQEIDPWVVYKGSIAIDGISLTVAEAAGGQLSVAIVPHTYAHTIVQFYRPGSRVNLECDIIAKYVAKLLTDLRPPSRLTVEKLREMGY